MTATGMSPSAAGRSPAALAVRALFALGLAFLAWQALHFFVRDPVRYLTHYTPETYHRYWPRRIVLVLHILGGSVALLTGPFQLWTGLRRRNLTVHRMLGLAYITGILFAGASAFYLAFFAEPLSLGVPLFALASVWWITVGMAFLAIRRKQIDSHRQWMIRGYVVTFAFVSFRYLTGLPLFTSLGDERFTAIGWLCWIVPLVITEVALQWRRTVGPPKRRVAAPLQH